MRHATAVCLFSESNPIQVNEVNINKIGKYLVTKNENFGENVNKHFFPLEQKEQNHNKFNGSK